MKRTGQPDTTIRTAKATQSRFQYNQMQGTTSRKQNLKARDPETQSEVLSGKKLPNTSQLNATRLTYSK